MDRFSLRQLPFPAKLVVTVFLLSVGLGYMWAMAQLHFKHASPGEPMPGVPDVVAHFSGVPWPLEAKPEPAPEPKPEDKPFIMYFAKVMGVGVIFAVIGWFFKGNEGSILSSNATDAFFMFCIPVIFFFATIYFKSNEEEKKPLGTMFTIFLVVILFWAIFKQNGTALTIYANNYTDRECPTAFAPAAKAMP